MNGLVFLDRDGTLNQDTGYVYDPETIELIPGAAEAVAALREAGFGVVVISNQSAIGRGMASSPQVDATNRALAELLLDQAPGAKLDAVLYCPHLPGDNCECRKPKTGLLKFVPESIIAPFEQCWMVGDKTSDILFGQNAGIPAMQTILVRTGYGHETERKLDKHFGTRNHPQVCDDLKAAADLIVKVTKEKKS